MKKLIFISLLITSFSLCSLPIKKLELEENSLLELCDWFSIPNDQEFIQHRFARKEGVERWDLNELSLEDKSFVVNWAKRSGFLSEITPSKSSYDTALVLGATTPAMKRRLGHLVKLFNDGVKFSNIVWLTSQRSLDPKVDAFCDIAKTESDAAKILWEREDLPKDLRDLPVVFLDTPLKILDKFLRRPNTKDTIELWLSSLERKRDDQILVLFISNQPFAHYQYAVIKSVMPDDVDFDIAAPSSLDPKASVVLDSVALFLRNR